MNETTCLQLLLLYLAYWTSDQQSNANKMMRIDTVFWDNTRSDVCNYKPNTRSTRYKDWIKKELKFYLEATGRKTSLLLI